MLHDRTNRLASPSVLKPLKYSLGIVDENDNRSPMRTTISGFVEAEPAIRAPAVPVVVEEDEEFKALRTDFGKIQLATRFDEIFGDINERTTYDATVLKRQPPAPDQKIFGYALEYLKQETGRLGEGFKKLRSQRDNLLRELLDVHSKQETAFEKLSSVITKMRHDKVDVQRKVHDLEKRLRAEMVQSEKAKAALGKEAEQVSRAELACQEAKAALADCERLLAESESHERDVRKRCENADRLAHTQAEELEKLREELNRSQKSNDDATRTQTEELQAETERWRRKEQHLEHEILNAKARLEEIRARLDLSTSEMQLLRGENQRKETQVEAMKERASVAEQKLNEKDGSVNLALQTLRETQDMIQSRIDGLNQEKIRLEGKVEEMLVEKKQVMDRVYEASGQLDRARDREEQLTGRVLELERNLMETNTLMATVADSLESARADAMLKTTKYMEAREQLEKNVDQLNSYKAKYTEASRETAAIKDRIAKMETEQAALRRTLDKLSNSPKKMERVLEESKEAENLKRKVGDAEYYREKMEELETELESIKRQLFDADAQRRTLLNEVQSLKGNIQVIARVRPSMRDVTGLRQNEISQLICSVDGMGLSLDIKGDQKRNTNANEQYPFTFNRVFDPDSSQHSVFEEVSSFVQSALDGFNVCLFAYGQTGSGKTWTMTGDLTNQLNRGIVPRSIDFILCYVAQMREKGWIYDVECSYMEICNETIRDLLTEDPKTEKSSRHDILHRGGSIVVTGLRKVKIQDIDEAQMLLEHAEALRSADCSKTHTVFAVHLVGRNAEKGDMELVGNLTLCDLAGSEVSSNQGLSALTGVFNSLAQKAMTAVPFKNSALTHILSPCLSGDGKTLMIVNVSSDHDDVQESLSALRFAQLVNKTEVGKPKKNMREGGTVGGNTATRGRNNSQ